MSLQASVHYYSQGGNVPTSEIPRYMNRFGRNPLPVFSVKRSRSESPVKRPNPIKVDIRQPGERIGIFPDPLQPKLMSRGGITRNEMQNMVMGSHTPHSVPIGSIHFESGGKVPYTPDSKTVLAEIPTKGVDKVPALLQTGEIVIPKKYATKVNKMLKAQGIHLPGC